MVNQQCSINFTSAMYGVLGNVSNEINCGLKIETGNKYSTEWKHNQLHCELVMGGTVYTCIQPVTIQEAKVLHCTNIRCVHIIIHIIHMYR